jgi:hypothetical protein
MVCRMLYILHPCPVLGSLIACLGPAMPKQSGSQVADLGLTDQSGLAKHHARTSLRLLSTPPLAMWRDFGGLKVFARTAQ